MASQVNIADLEKRLKESQEALRRLSRKETLAVAEGPGSSTLYGAEVGENDVQKIGEEGLLQREVGARAHDRYAKGQRERNHSAVQSTSPGKRAGKKASGILTPATVAKVQQLASTGNVRANYSLGLYYERGAYGLEQNFRKALQHYEVAAARGDSRAQ